VALTAKAEKEDVFTMAVMNITQSGARSKRRDAGTRAIPPLSRPEHAEDRRHSQAILRPCETVQESCQVLSPKSTPHLVGLADAEVDDGVSAAEARHVLDLLAVVEGRHPRVPRDRVLLRHLTACGGKEGKEACES